MATTDRLPRCARTNQGATVHVQLHDGLVLSCDSQSADAGISAPATLTVTGKITGGDARSLVMDDCETGQDCIPDGIRIDVDAPDLDLTMIPRVWARVRYRFSHFRACQLSLEITTANPTDGSSPADPAGLLLLAVNDGGEALEDSPFTVDRVRLGCHLAPGCGSPAPDEYAFDFHPTAQGPGASVRVYMGEMGSWQIGPRSYKAHNLRSYQTEVCDDYWNFAYTIVSRSL
jgi:hypothetical protein